MPHLASATGNARELESPVHAAVQQRWDVPPNEICSAPDGASNPVDLILQDVPEGIRDADCGGLVPWLMADGDPECKTNDSLPLRAHIVWLAVFLKSW